MESLRWMVILLMAFHFPFAHTTTQAQVAGLNTLAVFDLSTLARTSALGMDYLALFGDDISIAIDNPSMIQGSMAGTGILSFVPMFEGSNMGSLSYAHTFNRLGTFVFGFHFMNYGRFHEYDETETSHGDFGAGDYSLHIGWGMWLDSSFSIGVNFKPVLSQYEGYTAFAVAFDLAGSYSSASRAFAATVMARNIGAQIVTFDETVERLPFELSAEVSYKLSKAPFRFFFAATELQRWNLRYDDPNNPTSTVDFTGEVTEEGWLEGAVDNLMRHTLFGVELSLGKALFARVGYSYRQAQEMVGSDGFNTSGFSFGVGIRTRRFEFSYARHNYHVSQAPNYLTLSYRF